MQGNRARERKDRGIEEWKERGEYGQMGRTGARTQAP